jgi:hypothetical protein
MKKFSIFLFLFSHILFAIDGNTPQGARSAGLGHSSVTFNDSWAVFNNIAGIAALENACVGAAYEQKFNFKGFNTIAFAANMPTKFGNAGLGIYRFGDEIYNETRFNFGWAHRISFVSLGFQVEYFQVNIQDLGARRNLVLNFGGQANITKELVFGAHIYNLNQAKLAEYKDERLPTVMKTGLSYKPIKQLFLAVEVLKDIERPVCYKFGVEYEIVKFLKLRTGLNVQPQVSYFGIGYQNTSFSLDYATTWHQQLGFSHTISLNFRFAKLGTKPQELK